MKKLLFFLLFASAGYLSNAQYVKSYNTTPQTNLQLNCISKAQNGNYFIAGTSDQSIYVAEVNAAGNVIHEKLIGIGSNVHNLRSMITDADGNIVIIGEIKGAITNTNSYLMKISPALSLVMYKTYNNTSLGNGSGNSVIFLNDIKDFPQGNLYYLCGSTRRNDNNTGADALLITVNRQTGALVNIYNGNKGEDSYDAFVFPQRQIRGIAPGVIATGRIGVSIDKWRPWLNIHAGNLSFVNANRYLLSTNNTARLYSSSLINDFAFRTQLYAYCWVGDLKGTDYGLNTGLSVFRNDLSPVWQREYSFTPSSGKYVFLNKIAAEPGGYVAEGNWWDGFSTTNDGAIVGEMIMLRTDKNGTPIWSRKINNVYVNQRSHNASFLIDGNNIYAVGFKPGINGGVKQGALVQMRLADGAMNVKCALVQTVAVKTYDYNTPDSISPIDVSLKDTIAYYPVDCIQTQNETKCNEACDSIKLNADFDLTGSLTIGNIVTYSVNAANYDIVHNSEWIVSDVTSGTPTLIEHDPVGGAWSLLTSTNFGGYYGNTHINMGSTTFYQQHKYRFQHVLSATNNCGILSTDTITKVIYMGTSFRGVNGNFIIINEPNGKQNAGSESSASASKINMEEGKTVMYPNPANASITLDVSKLHVANPVVQIFSSAGQPIQTIKILGTQQNLKVNNWASGSYTYNIISGGKIVDSGKFVVQH
jgi:hypothetical protein